MELEWSIGKTNVLFAARFGRRLIDSDCIEARRSEHRLEGAYEVEPVGIRFPLKPGVGPSA
jgi:hypothetical protein